MASSSPTVQYISECFIKPQYYSEESKKAVYLSSWDLAMLSVHYIQKGLLFTKPDPSSFDTNPLLHKLKESLSLTLVQFYPLAGRLSTLKQENPHLYTVFIDCVNTPGAKFIHANLDLTVSDILSPKDVPLVVQSFFDHDKAINHDGHELSLCTIQVTELIDGVFIGCSMNHVVADGSSFWLFFNTFSEIFRKQTNNNNIHREIPHVGFVDREDTANLTVGNPPAHEIKKLSNPISKSPPVHNHWFPEGHGPVINLPYTHHDQFTSRHVAPVMRERFFHFSAESLKKLKAKANEECETETTKISSLQALSAHMWRCITKVRNFPPNQMTSCRMAINNRPRIQPPLAQEYFGNCIQTVRGIAAAGELLEHGVGWAAWKLHQAVANHKNKEIREWVEKLESGMVYQLGEFFDPCSVMMGSSPRFDMYGNEFGLGKAVALRSGYANKFDGKVSLYPGIEGDGSMDLEVCLSPEFMATLESDKEFLDSLSS